MRSVFLVYILNDRNNHKEIQCFIFKDVAFSRKFALRLKLQTLITLYAKFLPISAVKSFVVFPFKGDYLNIEMIKTFYLKKEAKAIPQKVVRLR
jgi:hypothetical protein